MPNESKRPNIIVRRLESRDEEALLGMRQALWPNHTVDEHRAEMHELVADPFCATLVAVQANGSLVGFLEASTRKYADGCDTSPVGYIEGWYVDPDFQRQGIGKLLVQAAEAWARENELSEMASDCLIDNDESLQAHLALGYQEVERLIHFKKLLLVNS